MKIALILIVGLLLVALIAYAMMAIQSHKKPDTLGLLDDMLLPCPDSPNCVCSEVHSQKSVQHTIDPIELKNHPWNHLKSSIVKQGGRIEFDDDHYLHATFTSTIFRYVDDVELRLDTSQKVIHIRSASRMGRSDFGVNRKRIEQIKQILLLTK